MMNPPEIPTLSIYHQRDDAPHRLKWNERTVGAEHMPFFTGICKM